jgi:hypothetical protein
MDDDKTIEISKHEKYFNGNNKDKKYVRGLTLLYNLYNNILNIEQLSGFNDHSNAYYIYQTILSPLIELELLTGSNLTILNYIVYSIYYEIDFMEYGLLDILKQIFYLDITQDLKMRFLDFLNQTYIFYYYMQEKDIHIDNGKDFNKLTPCIENKRTCIESSHSVQLKVIDISNIMASKYNYYISNVPNTFYIWYYAYGGKHDFNLITNRFNPIINAINIFKTNIDNFNKLDGITIEKEGTNYTINTNFKSNIKTFVYKNITNIVSAIECIVDSVNTVITAENIKEDDAKKFNSTLEMVATTLNKNFNLDLNLNNLSFTSIFNTTISYVETKEFYIIKDILLDLFLNFDSTVYTGKHSKQLESAIDLNNDYFKNIKCIIGNPIDLKSIVFNIDNFKGSIFDNEGDRDKFSEIGKLIDYVGDFKTIEIDNDLIDSEFKDNLKTLAYHKFIGFDDSNNYIDLDTYIQYLNVIIKPEFIPKINYHIKMAINNTYSILMYKTLLIHYKYLQNILKRFNLNYTQENYNSNDLKLNTFYIINNDLNKLNKCMQTELIIKNNIINFSAIQSLSLSNTIIANRVYNNLNILNAIYENLNLDFNYIESWEMKSNKLLGGMYRRVTYFFRAPNAQVTRRSRTYNIINDLSRVDVTVDSKIKNIMEMKDNSTNIVYDTSGINSDNDIAFRNLIVNTYRLIEHIQHIGSYDNPSLFGQSNNVSLTNDDKLQIYDIINNMLIKLKESWPNKGASINTIISKIEEYIIIITQQRNNNNTIAVQPQQMQQPQQQPQQMQQPQQQPQQMQPQQPQQMQPQQPQQMQPQQPQQMQPQQPQQMQPQQMQPQQQQQQNPQVLRLDLVVKLNITITTNQNQTRKLQQLRQLQQFIHLQLPHQMEQGILAIEQEQRYINQNLSHIQQQINQIQQQQLERIDNALPQINANLLINHQKILKLYHLLLSEQRQQHVAKIGRLKRRLIILQRLPLNRIEAKLNSYSQELYNISTNLDRLQPQIDRLQPQIDRLQPQIDRLQPQIDQLQTSLDNLSAKLDQRQAELYAFELQIQQAAQPVVAAPPLPAPVAAAPPPPPLPAPAVAAVAAEPKALPEAYIKKANNLKFKITELINIINMLQTEYNLTKNIKYNNIINNVIDFNVKTLLFANTLQELENILNPITEMKTLNDIYNSLESILEQINEIIADFNSDSDSDDELYLLYLKKRKDEVNEKIKKEREQYGL